MVAPEFVASEAGLNSLVERERRDAAQKALTEAIKEIDLLEGNELYQKAWKRATKSLRALREREEF